MRCSFATRQRSRRSVEAKRTNAARRRRRPLGKAQKFRHVAKHRLDEHDWCIRSRVRVHRIRTVISARSTSPPSLRKCFQFKLKRSTTASAMSRLMLCNLGNTSAAGNDTNNNANTNSSMEDDDSYPLPTIYRYVCKRRVVRTSRSHWRMSRREAGRIRDREKEKQT